jgi:hypothetical protein
MPIDFALFTREIPAASSGASSRLSDASTASLRMADIRIMIDDDPRPQASSETRQALTVALVKPGRGASRNQAINSSSAMLYTLFVMGEETLSSTRAFNFCHCAIFSTAIKSLILGPVVGPYRKPVGHYLGGAGTSRKEICEPALRFGCEGAGDAQRRRVCEGAHRRRRAPRRSGSAHELTALRPHRFRGLAACVGFSSSDVCASMRVCSGPSFCLCRHLRRDPSLCPDPTRRPV